MTTSSLYHIKHFLVFLYCIYLAACYIPQIENIFYNETDESFFHAGSADAGPFMGV